MSKQFADIQIYSPVQEHMVTLQLELCNLWQRTHWWASVKLPGHSVSPKSTAQMSSPSTPAWKNVLRLRVFDSWLDLCCHISLTPHVPVFVAIKTNKTLLPTVPLPKNSIKTKQWTFTAHYSYCNSLTGINRSVSWQIGGWFRQIYEVTVSCFEQM